MEIKDFKSEATPIHLLPNEVLLAIFELFFLDYFDEYLKLFHAVPTPIHICRKWRKLSLTTPKLWKNLRLQLKMNPRYYQKYCTSDMFRYFDKLPHSFNLGNFELFLSCMESVPVTLFVQFGDASIDSFTDGDFSSFLRLIDGFLLQRYIEYDWRDEVGLMYAALPLLAPDRYANLEHLELMEAPPEYKIKAPLRMPVLRVLIINTLSHLQAYKLLKFLKAPLLDSLGICMWETDDDPLPLRRFPNLRGLGLDCPSIWNIHGDLDYKSISHPKIERIAMYSIGCTSYLFRCQTFLPCINDWTLPGVFLEALLRHTSSRQFGYVTVLTIEPVANMCPQSGVSFWDSFPNLETLTLMSSVEDLFRVNAPRTWKQTRKHLEPITVFNGVAGSNSTTDGPTCPNLKHMKFVDMVMTVDGFSCFTSKVMESRERLDLNVSAVRLTLEKCEINPGRHILFRREMTHADCVEMLRFFGAVHN